MMREITDNNSNISARSKDNNQLFISKLTAVTSTAFQKQQEKRQALGPLDILCGRTSTAFNHEGNKRFRQIIALNLQGYMDAPTRYARSVAIVSVVNILRQDMGARFFKTTKNDSGGYHVELNKRECHEKVGHALRDLAAAAASAAASATATTTAITTAITTQMQQQQEHVVAEKGSSKTTHTEVSAVKGVLIDPICDAPSRQESSSTTSRISACESEWIKILSKTMQEGKELESIDCDIDPIPLSELGESCPYSFLQEMSSSSSSSYDSSGSCSSSGGSAEAYNEFDDDELESQFYDLLFPSEEATKEENDDQSLDPLPIDCDSKKTSHM